MIFTNKNVFHCKKISLTIFAVALASLHQPVFAAGGYLSVEAGAKVFKHADIQASLDGPNSPVGAADGDITGEAIALIGGMPVQGLPALSSGNQVLEVQVHYATADESDSLAATAFGFVPVNGVSISDGVPSTTLDYETEFDQYGIDLLVRSELSKTATSKTAVAWGLTYSRFSQEHEFSGRAMGMPITNVRLDDDITTDYFGLALGIDTEHQLGSGWVFTASGRVDLLYADADLDADQTLTIFGAISQNDDESKFAGQLQGKLGLAKDFGGFTLGATATASYLSYAPRVEYSLLDTNVFPAHLEDESLTTYGLNLYLQVPF